MAGEISQAMQVMPTTAGLQSVMGNGLVNGMQAGHQMDVGNSLLDLGVQGAQMSNDSQSMNLTQQAANQPLLNAQRGVAMGTAQDEQAQQNEGLPQALARSNIATKLSANEAAQLSTVEKKKMAIGDAATEMDESMKGQSAIPLPMQQMARARWKSLTGQDLPTDPAEARELIGRYADWNANTAPKLAEKAKAAAAENLANINNTSREKIAQGKVDASVQNAQQKALAAAKDPKKIEEGILAYQSKRKRGETTTAQEDEDYKLNMALYTFGKAQGTGSRITGAIDQQPTASESVVSGALKGTPAAAATPGGYSPNQESMIKAVMDTPANKGITREQVIKALKDKGKL